MAFSPDGPRIAAGTGPWGRRGRRTDRRAGRPRHPYRRRGVRGARADRRGPGGGLFARRPDDSRRPRGSRASRRAPCCACSTPRPAASCGGPPSGACRSSSLAFSPDGRTIATGCGHFNDYETSGYVRLRDAKTGGESGRPIAGQPRRRAGRGVRARRPAPRASPAATSSTSATWPIRGTRSSTASMGTSTSSMPSPSARTADAWRPAAGTRRSASGTATRAGPRRPWSATAASSAAWPSRPTEASSSPAARTTASGAGTSTAATSATFHGHTGFVHCVAFGPDGLAGRIGQPGWDGQDLAGRRARLPGDVPQQRGLGRHPGLRARRPPDRLGAQRQRPDLGPAHRRGAAPDHRPPRAAGPHRAGVLARRLDPGRLGPRRQRSSSGTPSAGPAAASCRRRRPPTMRRSRPTARRSPPRRATARSGSGTSLGARHRAGIRRPSSGATTPSPSRPTAGRSPRRARIGSSTSGTRRPACEVASLTGHETGVRDVAFSPDGRFLASVGGAYHGPVPAEVKVWDWTIGREVASYPGHTSLVTAVAYFPDGRRLATASDDRTIKLWDIQSRENVLTLRGHTSGVLSLAISGDGRQVASGSIDYSAKIWSIESPTGEAAFELSLRRAAVERVQSLYARHLLKEDVLAELRADRKPEPSAPRRGAGDRRASHRERLADLRGRLVHDRPARRQSRGQPAGPPPARGGLSRRGRRPGAAGRIPPCAGAGALPRRPAGRCPGHHPRPGPRPARPAAHAAGAGRHRHGQPPARTRGRGSPGARTARAVVSGAGSSNPDAAGFLREAEEVLGSPPRP